MKRINDDITLDLMFYFSFTHQDTKTSDGTMNTHVIFQNRETSVFLAQKKHCAMTRPIIYSVSVNVDALFAEEWVDWMRTVHIPEVMATGMFEEFTFHRLVDPPAEGDNLTFNVQYRARSMEDYLAYQREHAPALQRSHSERYKDKFVAFRTILEVM